MGLSGGAYGDGDIGARMARGSGQGVELVGEVSSNPLYGTSNAKLLGSVVDMDVGDTISLSIDGITTLRHIVSLVNNRLGTFPSRRYAQLIDEEDPHYDIRRIK